MKKFFKREKVFSEKGLVLKKNESFKAATFREMLRYATYFDYFLLFVGILGSITAGILQPNGAFIMIQIDGLMMDTHQDIIKGRADLDLVVTKTHEICIKLAINAFCIFTSSYLSMLCYYCLCERQINIIRKKFFYSILNQDMEWLDVNQVGALTQKMSSGIDRIKDGMSDKIGVLCHAATSIISGTALALYLNWKMTAIMWCVAPFLTISLFYSANAMKKAIKVEMEAYSFAGSIATEVISGIKTVMSFNAQNFEIDRYESYLNKAKKLGIRKAKITATFSALFSFFQNLAMAVGFCAGAILVFQGQMINGQVIGVYFAVIMGATRLGQAAPNLNAILSAKLAAGEIFAIIDKKPKFNCSMTEGFKLKNVKGDITFDNIHFSYPSRPTIKILNGVSFAVKSGQRLALVGHSGCGKSTTLGLLIRFYEPLKGSITLDGIHLEDLNLSWLRKTIGIVSQEPVLFATTVEENLKMGENISLKDLIEACKTANAYDFITMLPQGFETLIGEGGVKLSGGQKQRLAIARALVGNPKILLLDEATSALDTESERLVQDALDRASEGRTTITIAHRLSTIKNADSIIVFEKGETVEEGNHESLMEKAGVYAKLVFAQTINKHNSGDDESEEDYDSSNEFLKIRRKNASESADDSERLKRESIRISKSIANVDPKIDEDLNIEKAKISTTFFDIFKYAKPVQRQFICGFILSILTGMRYTIIAFLLGKLFGVLAKLPEGEGLNEAIWISAGFLLLAVVSCLTTYFSGFFLGSAGEKMASRLRMAVFTNIMHQDGYYFDKPGHSVGKLTSRLASDAHHVQGAIDQRLSEVLIGISSLGSGILLCLWWGPLVTVVSLIPSIIFVTFKIVMSNYLKKRGMKDLQSAEESAKIASEGIENVKTIQSLSRQDNIYANFCSSSEKPHRRALIRGLFQSTVYAMGLCFSGCNFSISYAIGIYMVRDGYTSPQILFQIIEALTVASITIIAAATYFPEYLRARLSAQIMFEMMNEEPKINAMSQSGTKPLINGNIDLKNVTFSYPNGGKHLTLNNISISVLQGKNIALVGPSGSGKSTVIQLLERFYDTLNGIISIDKTDIRQMNVPWLRNASAVVGQENILFNLTIRENISYGMKDVSMEKIIEAAKLANINEFIESLPEKYETNIGNKGTQLSGGQRQRIAIARAIIRNPKILLLDEATSALDTESERIVQDALERASYGRTCITVAHRLSTIQNADLIVVIKDGKVVEYGNHQQLLTRKGLYYRMVQKQHMD